MSHELPSIELLRKIIRYNPETGEMFWLERTPDMFPDGKRGAELSCKRFNSTYAGKPAFTTKHSKSGYKRSKILGAQLYAHRLAWALHYGEWPSMQIDHINGDTLDNRIANLRDVTRSDNMKNTSIGSTNTSGHLGVSFDKKRKQWRASITSDKRFIYLGRFKCKDEAIEARRRAEEKFGFHENHGRSLDATGEIL